VLLIGVVFMYVSEFLAEIVGAQARELQPRLAKCFTNEYHYFKFMFKSLPEQLFDNEALTAKSDFNYKKWSKFNIIKFEEEVQGVKQPVASEKFVLFDAVPKISVPLGEPFFWTTFGTGCDDYNVRQNQVSYNQEFKKAVNLNLSHFQKIVPLFDAITITENNITPEGIYASHTTANALNFYYKQLDDFDDNLDYKNAAIRNRNLIYAIEQSDEMQFAFNNPHNLNGLIADKVSTDRANSSKQLFEKCYSGLFDCPARLNLNKGQASPIITDLVYQIGALKLCELDEDESDIPEQQFNRMASFLNNLADDKNWNSLFISNNQAAFWQDSVQRFVAGAYVE
jgi:hypothetical protein